MRLLANGLVAFVAFEHFMFLVLEMFLWQKPVGMRTFDLTADFARQSATLAANQGLYNGFLAAGLLWSLFSRGDRAVALKRFFLGCVIVAGIFGAVTAKASILWVQAAPAALALILVTLAQRGSAD